MYFSFSVKYLKNFKQSCSVHQKRSGFMNFFQGFIFWWNLQMNGETSKNISLANKFETKLFEL